MVSECTVLTGLELPGFFARALTPQTAETDAIRFLVGTQSLKYDNQGTLRRSGCSSRWPLPCDLEQMD
uniref:Uncharacterized protein n=1 Tax=Oryctolagus cuniculus TaxID=9986 RepID=G1SDF3_RABIT